MAGQGRPGRYQILAASNAVHTSARDVRDTDWSQAIALHDQLSAIDPSPIVALNRAVALAELDGRTTPRLSRDQRYRPRATGHPGEGAT
ncbi:MAG: hypothetical protein ABI746_07905 [Dermatophilaceae bacterium]